MESCGARMADADKTSATWLKVKLIVSGYNGDPWLPVNNLVLILSMLYF